MPINKIEELKTNYYKEKAKKENHSTEAKEHLEEHYFTLFDSELAANLNEPHWLKDDQTAKR